MAANKEYQFKKLDTLLSNSFNNLKRDVTDISTKIDNLKRNVAELDVGGIKTAFEEQTRSIFELNKSMALLGSRVLELENERKKNEKEDRKAALWSDEHKGSGESRIFKTKESALNEVRKIVAETGKQEAKEEKSVYDIPEGQVRITKTQFKAPKGKGKKNLNEEWVEVTGYGVDLSGYKIHDKGRKHVFEFPRGFTIYGPVKLFSGKGKNTNTKLYWNSSRPVWNDLGDVATLRKGNAIVSQIVSEPTFSFKVLK
jgi:hypothetical protein